MPPKKKGGKKGSELGRAIIRRAAQDSRQKRSAGLGFAVADSLVDADAPLQSVTDLTSLEEFLSHAALADKHFTAERGAPTFVSSTYDINGAVDSAPDGADATAVAGGTTVLRWLRIPRRPRWEATMSAAELHKAENDAFLKWRRDVAQQEAEIQGAAGGTALAFSGGTSIGSTSGAAGASVTPFEKNLAIWQQLWRVVERAHVLVQIVDARDPLFYYCPDVDSYAREVHPDKGTLVLINKADFLSPRQRVAWAAYFAGQGVACAFFSAKAELDSMEAEDAARRAAMGAGMGLGSFEESAAAAAAAIADSSSASSVAGSSASGSKSGAAAPSVAASAAGSGGPAATKGKGKGRGKALTGTKSRFSALALDDDSSSDDGKAGSGSKTAGAAADADADDDEDGEEDEGEEEEEVSSAAPAALPAPAAGGAGAPPAAVAASAPAAESAPADASASDPSISPVLTRDQLVDFLNERYGHLARTKGVGGKSGSSANPASLAKLKELRATQRAAAAAARAEEMRRRAALAEKMIHAGLGAQVRFGDIGDVAGSGAAASAGSAAGGAGAGAGAGAGDDDEAFDDAFDGSVDGEGDGDGRPAPLMVGMVGYPNVGKSSTINALLGATASAHSTYRVAVAATPGKTKHFQTLPLTDTLTLVDCPGLVFPSFVATREEMVVNGVLPIDQLRDHAAPIRLVCSRVPRHVFEQAYGIKLPVPAPPQDPGRQPTPGELLDTFCTARGLMGATHAGCDHPRGSRLLLRDYTDGRLLYAHPPPGGWIKWVPANLAAGNDTLEPALGSAAPAPAPVEGAAVGAGKAGKAGKAASRWENVLVPAGSPRPAAGVSASAAARAAPSASAAAAPDSDEEDEDDDDEEASPEELAELAAAMEESAAMAKTSASRSAASAGLDDAALRSFSRVVYLADDSDSDDDDDEAEDEDEDGSDGEDAHAGAAAAADGSSARVVAPPVLSAAPLPIKAKAREVAGGGAHIKGRSKVHLPLGGTAAAAAAGIGAAAGSGAGAAADGEESDGEDDGDAGAGTVAQSASGAGSHRIAPKRQMKKERRLRKGERRIDDPYGTAAVAEAAARRDHLAEVAAVNRGGR